ncbi:hypothetical protein DMENIID0001_106320 [Sergentomyia squamirostris]
MWILVNSSGTKFFLSGDKEVYTVGRDPKCDLIIENDKSISRVHAHLKVLPDKLVLIDVGSSYGSFLNENIKAVIRLPPKEEVDLRNQDLIRFGRFDSNWSVEMTAICVVTSSICAEDVEILQSNVQALSGKVMKTWQQDCTHLSMPEIVITIKALLALVSAKPIVHPRYFSALLASLKANESLPDVGDFVPIVREENLLEQNCSFHPDQERSKVFSGKRFIFLSQEVMKTYQMVIHLAGGSCVNLETDSLSQRSYVQLGTIVVTSAKGPGARERDNAKRIEENLRQKGLRFIPDKEIALAIIYKSTRKFCNPRYDFKADFMANTSRKISNDVILVQDTPTFDSQSQSMGITPVVLPETIEEKTIPTTSTEKTVTEQISREDHVEIPETAEEAPPQIEILPEIIPEPPRHEKRKRTSWLQVEKEVEEPPRKSLREALADEAPSRDSRKPKNFKPQSSSAGEKRKLRNALDDDDVDAFNPFPKRAKQKNLPQNKKSQEKNHTQTTKGSKEKTQENFLAISLPRSTNPNTIPENFLSVELKSTGWITKMLANTTLDDSLMKTEKTEDLDEDKAWRDSLRLSIKIQPVSLSLQESHISVGHQSGPDSVDSSANTASCRNFKAFKKKQKFIAQRSMGQIGQITFNGGEWKNCDIL